MKKLKLFLSVDKEEQWINTIEEEGYRLTSINSIIPLYTFEETTNSEPYVPYVRLDYREKWMSREAYEEYIGLFSDSGWKLIKGNRYGGMQYFQQNRLDVSREIFSDKDSKNNMRKKYSNYSMSCGLLFILYTFISLNYGIGFRSIFNVKSWYLTPNIWELKGGRFLFSFIFETPFVLFRVFLPFIILGIGVYYLMKSIANKEKYN